MLLSSTCFAIINLMVKILSKENDILQTSFGFEEIQTYPPYELVFFRSIISLAICSAIIFRRRIPFFGNNKKWLIIRGIFGSAAITLFFYTLQNLPIAIATTVQYLSPLFTVVFAIFLLKEKIKWYQWIFLGLAMIGVFILGYSKNNNVEIPWTWLSLGLTSAVLSGVAYNAIIKCKETDEPVTVVMYFTLIASPVMLLACIAFGFVVPQGVEWIIILLIGVFTQMAQISMTRAFHADTAANVTPVKYVGAIYASLVGVFIFGEFINTTAYIGISLIIMAVLLNTFLKERKKANLQNN